MLDLLLLLTGFMAIMFADGLPVARAGLWREFVAFFLLWAAALFLFATLVLDTSPPNPVEWIIVLARLLSPVRDLLLPGIRLF